MSQRIRVLECKVNKMTPDRCYLCCDTVFLRVVVMDYCFSPRNFVPGKMLINPSHSLGVPWLNSAPESTWSTLHFRIVFTTKKLRFLRGNKACKDDSVRGAGVLATQECGDLTGALGKIIVYTDACKWLRVYIQTYAASVQASMYSFADVVSLALR